MKGHHEVVEELKELNVSFSESMRKDIFSLPVGYFDQFPGRVSEAVRCAQITASLPDESPFALPENYFEQFPARVQQRLLAVAPNDEIAELSPMLAGLKDKMPFEAPAKNYFDADPVVPSRTIEMPVVVRKVKWMRWAAAAAVLCIFSLGGFRFLEAPSPNAVTDTSIQTALASIPDAEIQQYLSLNIDAYDVYSLSSDSRSNTASEEHLLNSISDKEIEKILENEY